MRGRLKMEFTLKTVLAFLRPLLSAYDIPETNVMSVKFDPSGAEITQYVRDSDGRIETFDDEPLTESKFYPYLA